MRVIDSELNFNGKKVLLIGGAGFIGHNLALSLKAKGANVAILDSLHVNNLLSLYDDVSAPKERTLYEYMINERLSSLRNNNIDLFVEDGRDYHRMAKVFSIFEPEVVVLLAAVSHASRANKDPRTTLDHSFRTLENALDNSREKVKQFIFFSSSMVYGNFESESVTETSSCNPIGIYGAVKLSGEKLVEAYGRVFDIPYTIVRPSALYGERCISRRVGQIFIENAIRGKDLVIAGDGKDKIDFTYIEDLIQGIELCISNNDSLGQIFNLTFGKAEEINSLATIVQNEFPGISVKHGERNPLVPERGTLDISKAKDVLGYNPSHDIEIGFKKYISWYLEMGKNFNFNSINLVESQKNE